MSAMSSMISPEVLREAAGWMARMKDAHSSEADRRDFAEWLQRSPVHVRHYLELASLDVELVDPALFAGLEFENLSRKTAANVLPWPNGPAAEKSASRYSLKYWAVAATLVAVALGAFLVWREGLLGQQHYRSGLGELRSITLADGSVVTLNTQSDIRVRYSQDARLVELLRGEALFKVAKRPGRPFRVLVGSSVVEAVGTQFNVDRRKEGALVTVVEGRVSVLAFAPLAGREAATSDKESPVLLNAGEQLAVTAHATVRHLSASELPRVTTWTQRRLVFDQAPVSEVASQLNRYNRVQLKVTDPALAHRSVTGTFESSDPESFLEFLQQQGGVSVRARDDGSLELTGPVGGNTRP